MTAVWDTYVYWNPKGSYPERMWWDNRYSPVTSAATDYNKLGLSSVGGKYSDTESPWYYSPAYTFNNVKIPLYSGIPELRMFIDWHEIEFSNTDVVGIIYVPENLSDDLEKAIHNYTGTQIRIGAKIINADEAQTGMQFENWRFYRDSDQIPSYDDQKIYKSYCYPSYIKEIYILQFPNIMGVAPNRPSIEFQHDDSIQVSVSYMEKETRIRYQIGLDVVYYSLPTKYAIKSYGSILNSMGNPVFVVSDNSRVPDLDLGAIYTINPEVELKSYNITFQ